MGQLEHRRVPVHPLRRHSSQSRSAHLQSEVGEPRFVVAGAGGLHADDGQLEGARRLRGESAGQLQETAGRFRSGGVRSRQIRAEEVHRQRVGATGEPEASGKHSIVAIPCHSMQFEISLCDRFVE